MDEVFDNMGGGRNSKGNGGSSGGGKGITQSNLVGLNYSDDWSKSLAAMGSYDFSNSVNNNDHQNHIRPEFYQSNLCFSFRR